MTQVIDGEYDYIIVGAGSSGCLLANRLSADADKRVLVLEAGGRDNWIWYHIPVGYLFSIGNPRSDWMYRTLPEEGLNGRSLPYPRGKVIGGSSAINAMLHARPGPRLRSLAPARPFGLGMGRRAAVLQAARGPLFRRERCAWRRRRMPRRAPARAVGPPGDVSPSGGAGRHRADRRFQYRRQRGLGLLPGHAEARPALVGGAWLPHAGAAPAEPAARARLPRRGDRVRAAARSRRALAPGRSRAARALPRRDD